jgi:hypothetical protein
MPFVSLKSVMGKVLKRCNVDPSDVASYGVFDSWETIAGDRLAAHTKPVRITRGILYIEVDDPLWHAQLKYLKTGIIEKIDTTIRQGAVKDIKFYLKGF